MSDNWVVQNLQNALDTWNKYLSEIWQLITQSPEQFKGGSIWSVIVNIHDAVRAIGLALLVLFFVVGVMKTCGSFAEVKKPEHALKLFIRFAIAKGVVTYGLELMIALFNIVQGLVSTIMNAAGFGSAQQTVLPQEIVTAVEDCGFFESIPLWAVTLIGGLIVTVLSFIMIMTVYGRFFKDNMVTELTDFNRNLMLSIDVVPVPTDEAVREVENRLLGVETNITNWQRRQNANNNFSAVVPYDMEQQRKESKEFLDDLTTRDQRMMFAVITMAITADTKEQLDSDTEAVLSVARKHMCQLAVLKFQQLDGLNTALPIGARKINAFRTLTTESLAVFIPFKVQEIQDKGGIYFGENAISHNLIMCNKANLLNQSAFYLGVPGAGKSFAVKELIAFLMLHPDYANDEVLICDPEGEFGALVKALGREKATVAHLVAGGKDRLNAMYMVEGYGEQNPIVEKAETDTQLVASNIRDSSAELVELRKEEQDIASQLFALQKRHTEMLQLRNSMGQYEESLQVQLQRLEISTLTLKVKNASGRDDYLWEIGSASNWLAYHIATILAFQQFFQTRGSVAVPNFVIFDQPSQVYFPQRSRNSTLSEEDVQIADEDKQAVQKIFIAMDKFLHDTQKDVQIIVTEHADEDIWGDVSSSHLVERWRGSNDKLIPAEWITQICWMRLLRNTTDRTERPTLCWLA